MLANTKKEIYMKIKCPKCETPYDIEEENIGAKAECGVCGHKFILQNEAKPKKNLGSLPLTKGLIEKLNNLGIKYDPNICRDEAKILMKKHADYLYRAELEQNIKAKGIKLPSNCTIDELEDVEGAEAPSQEQLDKCNELTKQWDAFGLKYKMPKILTDWSVGDFIDDLTYVIDEVEGAMEEFNRGFLLTETHCYSFYGFKPDEDFSAFKADIAKRAVKEQWESEKYLVPLIRKHFPNVVIEKERDT